MRKACIFVLRLFFFSLLLSASLLTAQSKRLWVLRAPDQLVEYDLDTFKVKQTVNVPAEAVSSPAAVSITRGGQILFAPGVSLPLAKEDLESPHKIWIWNGHAAALLDPQLEHSAEETGSNEAVTESAPAVMLAADGAHLFWFANRTRRLQRDSVDLSTTITWEMWRTDLNGGAREDLTSAKLPDCRCPTGTCEESCPVGVVWAPDDGLDKYFLMTNFVAGQTTPTYESTAIYKEDAGKWTPTALAGPLQRVLDADSGGNVIVEAIPDAGCCGWSNVSNDQTLVLLNGKTVSLFDEQATYKNPDYDVSFYTSNARLSPGDGFVAMTIVATAEPDKTIQLAEQGQANPEESARIRKALVELPEVVVKSVEDTPRQVAEVPHATLVGWISEKELLIVEDKLLVVYAPANGARRKTNVKVDDAAQVFLR